MDKTLFKKTGNQNGMLLGIVGVVISLIFWILDLDYETQQNFQWLGIIPTIIFMVVAIRYYKANSKGFIAFGDAFKLGLRVVAIAAIFNTAFMLLYTTVLHPNYQDDIIEASLEKMEEQGVPDEGIDMAISITEKMTSPFGMVAIGLFSFIFMGLIFSLIISAIMKKNNPYPLDETLDGE